MMSKKISLMLGIASGTLLLTACGGMSAEELKSSTDQLEESFNEIIQTHNQLVEHEENLNGQFEEVLAEDEELRTIQDETASVVENIQTRSSLVDEFQNHMTTINEQAQYIGTYDGDDFTEEEIQQLTSDFSAFTSELEIFAEEYQGSLDVQRDYLNQIAAEEANYEDFSAGIQTVNEDYAALQETTYAFDETLVVFENQLSAFQVEVESKIEEDGANTAKAQTDAEEAENSDETDDADEEIEETANDFETAFLTVRSESLLNIPDSFPAKFVYDSGVDIQYPADGVKGVYVTAHSAGGDRMNYLVDLMNSTELNAMVVDVKDDYGNITLALDTDNEIIQENTFEMFEPEEVMGIMEENDIYPIARIVVFKDTLLAHNRPDLSFTHPDGSVWTNNNGDGFVNPYLKEVWDYNLEVAIEVAKLGFKEIQFDYVRFPEGFELIDREVNYGHGDYGSDDVDVISMEYRNQAVTDFVAYSREQLQPYGVDVSVDIFGYAAVVRETPGIGQSFPGIAKEVDVISSMIYPSHWGPGNLGVDIPDLDPYNVVYNYAEVENEIMEELGEEAPISRPWIQDFTASYLGAGYFKPYGAQEVTDQVRALYENGINEFLLWNAGNTYSEGATYSFD